MSDRNLPGGKSLAPEDSVGAELRRLFDVEKEELPPFFSETLQLSRGIDEEIARYRGLEERALRSFFARIGGDYDALRRLRQRRRRWRAAGLSLGLLLVALAALLVASPGVLEALRLPLFQWFRATPTPITARSVKQYARVSDIQPYFSIPLPEAAPAGFRLVYVSLEQGFPAGPRAAISYQRGDPSDPDDPGAVASLLVWPLQDEPFPFPLEVAPEELDLGGRPAYWVAGTMPDGRVGWRNEGGWLLWEREAWKLALVSSSLSRDEMVAIGLQLAGQE